MPGLRYLHTCVQCSTSFDNLENTPKSEALCPHCTMLPPDDGDHYHVDAPTGITAGGSRLIHTKGKDHADYVETIDSGLTGGHIKGTANIDACKPHGHHVFKKKNCAKCKKPFQPNAGNCKLCPDCRPLTVIKTKQAKLYAKELIEPRKGRGRHVEKVSRVELEKLATGLISEPKDISQFILKDPVHYTPGLALLKKQETHTATLPGVWVRYQEAGMTYDKRNYVMSKNLITGEVCVDLWQPRERYLSDSSTANWIHGSPLAQTKPEGSDSSAGLSNMQP